MAVTTTPTGRSQDVCEAHYVDRMKAMQAARELPDDLTLQDLSEIFKVLSSPTRLKILHALSGQELCVCDLASVLGSTESAVSHQLRLLRGMRLVRYRREGKLAFYSLDDHHVHQLVEAGLEHARERKREPHPGPGGVQGRQDEGGEGTRAVPSLPGTTSR